MATEVFIPKMSDHMSEGDIVRWLAREGDAVQERQPILEVMTDKAVAEVEAPASGVLKGIRRGADAGATVPVGIPIAFIAAPDELVPVLPPLARQVAVSNVHPPAVGVAAPPAGEVRAAPATRKLAKELGVDLGLVRGTGSGGRITEDDVRAFLALSQPASAPEAAGVRASPTARALAKELGIDLARVPGSGPHGRVTREDVEASAGHAAAALPPAPAGEPDFEWIDLTPVQRITGQRMLESIQTAPHFALTISVDATNLLWLREAISERVQAEAAEKPSVTALLVKCVAIALKDVPRVNAGFEQGRIRLYKRVNLAVAIGAAQGLAVPVISDADRKSLAQVVTELGGFREKAEQMRFMPEDLAGGTFTITNLGMFGIDRFTAIINPPQSAILAVGRVEKRPVGMADDSIALRPIMDLTLSIDHRSLDGVQAAQFLARLKERIEKPYHIL